ncbi:MAG: hydantoinase/oxoprolinase family protein, partial [Alphaproteobacteria bacterium]|nr:hydantoinase/oxoprolinase family protein [Alphaproteobacteria bacterium]
AMGVLAIAEAHMVNAIKLISVDRGLDPRDFTLVGFGGAGPLHVMRLAEELAIGRVLVPPAPGNVSASGLLAADVRHDLVRTRVTPVVELDPATVAAELAEMAADAALLLDREDVAPSRRLSTASVDLRYQGQNYELTLPLPAGDLDGETLAALVPRFHAEHRRTYGYDLPGRTVQLVNLRLVAIGRVASARWPEHPAAREPARPAGRRRVALATGVGAELPVYRATDLQPDHAFEGPAIVEYPGSTLFVPPAWTVRYDAMRNAHVERVAPVPARKETRR